jgi:hypothetical protein
METETVTKVVTATLSLGVICLFSLGIARPTPAAAAETHHVYAIPVRAPVVQSLGLPGAVAARDMMVVTVRLLTPAPFRVRIFLTVRTAEGREVVLERDSRVRAGDLWATGAFDEPGILTHTIVTVRVREEPEPAALAESETRIMGAGEPPK